MFKDAFDFYCRAKLAALEGEKREGDKKESKGRKLVYEQNYFVHCFLAAQPRGFLLV